MFGYESGSFTGAHHESKPANSSLPDGAPFSWMKIGELPMDMQAKLLRVLQEKRFYRVGGTSPITSDVAHYRCHPPPNMAELVEQKLFTLQFVLSP